MIRGHELRVTRLLPGDPDFVAQLRGFAADPLFRGLRVSGAAVAAALADSTKRRDLEQLGDRDLALDVLCGPEELPSVAKLAAAWSTIARTCVSTATRPPRGSPVCVSARRSATCS